MGLTPLSPLGFVIVALRARVAAARTARDLGASTIEWVIITGILVLLAAAVGMTIYYMVTNQANSISIPDAPGGGGGGGGGNP